MPGLPRLRGKSAERAHPMMCRCGQNAGTTHLCPALAPLCRCGRPLDLTHSCNIGPRATIVWPTVFWPVTPRVLELMGPSEPTPGVESKPTKETR